MSVSSSAEPIIAFIRPKKDEIESRIANLFGSCGYVCICWAGRNWPYTLIFRYIYGHKKPMVHRIILIACLLLSIAACTRDHGCDHPSIRVFNLSERGVYCRFAEVADTFDWIGMSTIFGDHPREVGKQMYNDSTYFSLPGNTENRNIISLSYSCVGDLFDPGDPLKGIFVFFIDSAAVDTLSWDTVKARNIYSKLYKLNYEAMERANWVIQYPQ